MSILKHKLRTLAHAVTGLALALKGYAKLTDHHAVIGSIILISGLTIIGYVLYDSRQQKHNRLLGTGIHFLEGLALLFTSWVYFEEGKTYLPYATLAAAIGFFVTVPVLYRKNRGMNKKRSHDSQERRTVISGKDDA